MTLLEKAPVPATQLSHLQLLQRSQALLQEQKSVAESLKQENASLKHQLDWFKQQLFGEKSEKRLIDNPNQLALQIRKSGTRSDQGSTETNRRTVQG